MNEKSTRIIKKSLRRENNMDKREELDNKFWEQRKHLENKMQELSDIHSLKRRKWDEEYDIQQGLSNVLDNIAMSDPDAEKNRIFVESYYFIKDKSRNILDWREYDYEEATRACSRVREDIYNLEEEYYKEMEIKENL